jgi:protease II
MRINDMNTFKWICASGLVVVISGCSTLQPPTYSGHGAGAVDPKVVAAFAPSSLPADVSRFVQNMMEIITPGLGLLSPDGNTMYFTWTITGVPQIWKLDGPMRFPTQMTSGSDSTMISGITPDGKFLIVSRDHAGEENPGLYLLSTSGGPLIEVQHKKSVRTYMSWITTNSDKLYYISNDIKPDSYAIYSYVISTGEHKLLFSEPGLWSVRDVSGDDHFLLARATGASTREYFEWSPGTSQLTPVIGQGETEEYEVQFGVEPGQYFVLTAKFGDFKRLYSFRSGKFEAITPDVKMEVDGFNLDHRRFRMYIQWNDNGYSRLEVRDPQTLKIVAFPKIKGAESLIAGSPSRYGRFVPFAATSSLTPHTAYVYDWKENKVTQWSRPSIPEVDMSKFVPSQLESYPARDGVKIPMLVTRPKVCASDPCPVVVHFHGGPEGQSRPGFNKLAQIVAASGIIFVDPNVRGSEGYGKAYRQADDGAKRLNVITDIEDCAKYLKSAWSKNSAVPKVGVMGWSYGGYSTLVAMSKFAGAYDAGVALVGMSNLRTFLLNTAPYRRMLRISEYGDPEKDKDALEKLSPITYVNDVLGPLMIIQGVSDPRVPVGEALQFHNALQKRGVDSPLILFAEEGHGSIKRDDRVLELGHTLLFLKQHLLTTSQPGPRS